MGTEILKIRPVLSRFPQPEEASLVIRWSAHWTPGRHIKGLPCPGLHQGGRGFKSERSPPRIPSKLEQIIRCLYRNAWERWRLSGEKGFCRQRMEGNFLQIKDRVVIKLGLIRSPKVNSTLESDALSILD